MSTPEGKVQAHIKKSFEDIGALVRKIKYEGRNGCPDLLVLINGEILFIEVKKDENTDPEPHQIREHARMRKRGATVLVIGSKSEADKLVAKYK